MLIINSDSLVYAEGEHGGISTYAATSVNPTASLTIGGDAVDKQVITSPGSVGYRSHTVTVEASDIESYSIVISGPTNLESQTSTTVGGADNKTPASMSDNTWGYSWGDSSTTKESSTYQTLSPSGDSLSGDNVSSFGVNFTRNLFFAAKFSNDAEYGNYHADVTLSLAATPRAIATGFGSIRDMQDMTPEICNAATIGDSGSLEDIRDGSVYTVAKLSDGNCWMTQNLRITGYTTTEDDSQTGGITIPNTASNFTGSDNEAAYYGGDTDYGAYYSWYTATAHTGTATMTSGDASGSICPKGWRLPTGGSNGEFQTLYDKGKSGWTTNGDKNGYWIGAANSTSGAFFPAAGVYNVSSLNDAGSYGRYWSSTASSNTNAYRLYFDSSVVYPADGSSKYVGISVRCVAEKPKEPAVSGFGGIKKMQDMKTSICTNAAANATGELYDARDDSTYTIQKLSDGKCWMTQNLRIVNKATTATDSQTGGFTIPASAASGFTGTNNNAAYYSGDTAYGAYYSWYTATAGTGTSSVSSGDATGSICPKNWRLPTKTEYDTLYGKGNSGWTTNGGKNGYWIGAANATGGAFFPAAGFVGSGSLTNAGSRGDYWSSTASNASTAYILYFNSSDVYPADYSGKYFGLSVRCVAK